MRPFLSSRFLSVYRPIFLSLAHSLLLALALSLFFSLFEISAYAANKPPAPRPNIVILLSDDLGFSDLGCYGGPVKTPALDGLAAGGIRFTDFYSGAAVCSPSRAALLTGRHHIRTGIYSWIDDQSQRSHLRTSETTLAEILKTAGYATAHIGKWHLGLPTPTRKKPTPADHGFDYWFATWNNANPSHRNPENFIRNGTPVGKIEGYSASILVDEALAWLDRPRAPDTPFFLNIWFHEPHSPLAAPADLVAPYGDAKNAAAVYSGTIAHTDRAIARLLAKLRAISPPENTLILYASDNGSYRPDRVVPLRGQKGGNFEGGIRVPGIMNWPGTIAPGRVESTPAGLIDFLPTVCGLLAIAPPTDVHLDGADLAPLLRAPAGPGGFVRAQPLFWHLQRSRPIVALRDGRWSLTADPNYELSKDNMFRETWIPAIKAGGYRDWQLFDLEADPSQKTNLAATEPAVLARLQVQLLKINASIMAEAADWHLPE